jgi:prepilin-type N-terminal cleavage/methylation domain-containing protein
MIKKPDSAGFTLIEVLVATVVLSIVVYLAAMSYSVFLDVWGEKRFTDTDAINTYRTNVLLRSALESTYDYYVTDPENEASGTRYPWFKGKPQAVEFVTLSSVFNKGKPAAVRLRLEKQGAGANRVQKLLYEEAPLNQVYVKYYDQELKFHNQMTIYDQFKRIQFRFFGKLYAAPTQGGQRRTTYEWQESFDGKETMAIPETIELIIETEEGKTKLLFPIRANNYLKRVNFQGV